MMSDLDIPTSNSDKQTKMSRKPKPSKKAGYARGEKKHPEKRVEVPKKKPLIKDQILAGSSEEGASLRTEQTESELPILLSITSRQIGFLITQLLYIIRDLPSVNYAADCYQMYRVFLAIFEYRMSLLIKESGKVNRFVQDCYLFERRAQFQSAVLTLNVVPSALSALLEQLGILMVNNDKFVPVVRRDLYNRAGQLVPLPETVLFSNLQRIVAALQDFNIPQNYRARFRSMSPLPGAVWDNNDILTNAVDFWPLNYDDTALQNEIVNVTIMLASIKEQAEKLITVTPSLERAVGTKALTMCNSMGDLRQAERNPGQNLRDYYNSAQPTGNVSHYWSLFQMTPHEKDRGQFCLLGELSCTRAAHYPVYIPRQEPQSPWEYKTNYRGVAAKFYAPQQ